MPDSEVQSLQDRIDSLERQNQTLHHELKAWSAWRNLQYRSAYAAPSTSTESGATQFSSQHHDSSRRQGRIKNPVEELETARQRINELEEELTTSRQQISLLRRALAQTQTHNEALHRQAQVTNAELARLTGYTNVEKTVRAHTDDDDDDESIDRHSYVPPESSSETDDDAASSEDEMQRTSRKRARASCDTEDDEDAVQQTTFKRARVYDADDTDYIDDTVNTVDTDDAHDAQNAQNAHDAHDARDDVGSGDNADNEDGVLAKQARSLTIDPESQPEPERERKAVRRPRKAQRAGIQKRRNAEKLLPVWCFKMVTGWTRNKHTKLYNSEDHVHHMLELWKAIEKVKDAWEESEWGQSFMDDPYFWSSNIKKECLTRKSHGQRGRWRDGALGRYACQTCVLLGEPCFYWDGKNVLLLPLHKDDCQVKPHHDLDERTWLAA